MNKKQKTVVIILAALVVAVPAMYLLTRLLDRNWGELLRAADAPDTTARIIVFKDADYDENIFEDAVYMDKNRDIEYTEGAVSRVINENHALYGVGPAFFYGYFDAAIRGDAEALNAFYGGDYFSDNEPYERFTMQKIYNIQLEKLSEDVLEEGSHRGDVRYTFRVSYMIKDNNGTFRDDIASDAASPLIFELLDDGNRQYINSVVRYTYIND